MTKYLRYANLAERGLVKNRATLKNLIDKCGFPPGRLIGPNTRAWTEDEIDAYVAGCPVAAKPTPPSPRRRAREAEAKNT
jgi:predicted DNA-binding transcriptional regulator AlpA